MKIQNHYYSMCLFFLLTLIVVNNNFAQTTFQKIIRSGTNWSSSHDIALTPDGGYIIAGQIGMGAANLEDLYLVKTDVAGNVTWSKTYGGPGGSNYYEEGYSVKPTTDGGYILGGYSKCFGTSAAEKFYLIKTDVNGDTLWTRTYGGTKLDLAMSVIQTSDGGYMMVGETNSFSGSFDFYWIKTDANGTLQWTKTLGTGTGYEYATFIQQTTDGGFVLLGVSNSVTGTGPIDVWVIKTDASANVTWAKTYGETNTADYGYSIQQTKDQGYIVSGSTSGDIYLYKIDSIGNLTWSKTYKGASQTWGGNLVRQCTDGGYIVTGTTSSFGNGSNDAFLAKTDANGDLMWSKTYGGTASDGATSVSQTADGGYIIVGGTASFGQGGIYLIKTDSMGNSGCNETSAAPIVTTPSTVVTILVPVVNSVGTMGLPNTIVGDGGSADSTLCITQTLSVILTSQTNIVCNGGTTGSATIGASGGAPPYTYLWSPSGGSSATAGNLSAGAYTVTVTDGSGSITTISVTITQPSVLTVTASATAASCTSNNGSATANASGGTPGYTYSWSPFGGTNATATGLATGSYMATVTDSSGCTQTQTVTVVSSGSITVSQPAVICSGTTYTLPGGTVVSTGGTYIDTLTSASGCDSIITTTLTIDSVLTTIQSANICYGSVYTLPGGTVVSTGGTYMDTLTSTSGCDSIITTTLTVDSILTSNQSSVICSGSTYTLPGGTVVSIGGTYMDTLTSKGGCDSIITTTLIVNPNPTATISSIPIASGQVVTITQGQSVTLTASGGGTYSWNNGSNSSSIIVTPFVTTAYCLKITDANGCTDDTCITVTIEPIDCSSAGEFYLPNAFSPNGDGENDVLKIYYGNIHCIKTFDLIIYNRWGERVFQSTGSGFQWDGMFKGNIEGASVFVYYMKVILTNGEKINRKGNISLIR